MFPTFLKVGFAEMSAYRAEVVIWILTTTMPLIMYAMWSTVAREGALGRFDEATFAAYFLSTLIVRQLSGAWVIFELNYLVRTGRLSTLLLRPVHPLLYQAATNLSVVPFRVIVLIPVVGVALLAIPAMRFQTDAATLALYVFTCAFAWVLNFLIQATIGLLALYTEQSVSFQDAFFALWAILSGYLIPLELMPGVQPIANLLPFRAMGSLPTEILLGHLEGGAIAAGVLTQLAWVGLAFLALRAFWHRSMRRFEAYGS